LDLRFDESAKNLIANISSKFDPVYWRDIYRSKKFPNEYWQAIARSGLFGILLAKKWGGMERKFSDFVLAVEETAERYAGIASYLFLSGSLVTTIIASNATEEQKQELLPKLAKGELKISLALGEEISGLDATSIETKASKISDEIFELNGTKTFVNNVDQADYLIVFARTTPIEKVEKKSLGISMFLIDAKDPAIKRTELDKVGMDFVRNFNLKLDGLQVKRSQSIGELEKGWYNVLQSFNMDRVATSASLVGTGKLALNQASKWAKERKVFQKVIGSNQGIQFPLANAYAELETSWIMTLKASTIADAGKNYANEANYSLLTASNSAMLATDRALQTFGGHGYYKEYDVERYWRDVRVHKIHPISEELLLASISERALGLPRSY
jgi:acyl-CoA dehydrogenase